MLEGVPYQTFSKGKKKAAWRVTIESDGQSRDKRLTFSVMASLAARVFNSDSKGELSYFIAGNDPFVQFISGNQDAIKHYTMIPVDQLAGLRSDFHSIPKATLPNAAGDSVVEILALHGMYGLVKDFLDKGVSPKFVGESGRPLIVAAVRSGSLETVKLLIGRGARGDQKSATKSVLINAIDGGNLEVVKSIVEAGGSPDEAFCKGTNVNGILSCLNPKEYAESLKLKEIAKFLETKMKRT